MKTLYKNSRRIAAAIVGTFVFSAGAAVAVTKDSAQCETSPANHAMSQVEDMGRFVVTPGKATYVRAAEDIGRFVVSPQRIVFVPAAEKASV